MAEEKGFEPLRRSHDLPVFKTGPFNQTWVFLHLAFLQRQIDYSIINFKMSTKKIKIFHFLRFCHGLFKNNKNIYKKKQKSVANQKEMRYTQVVLLKKTKVPAQVAEQVDAQDLKSCEI